MTGQDDDLNARLAHPDSSGGVSQTDQSGVEFRLEFFGDSPQGGEGEFFVGFILKGTQRTVLGVDFGPTPPDEDRLGSTVVRRNPGSGIGERKRAWEQCAGDGGYVMHMRIVDSA